MRAPRLDYLLFPLARCFSASALDQTRWAREEEPDYVTRARLTGSTVLMINTLSDPTLMGGSFGGALVVRPDGSVAARLPLGQTSALPADLARPEA